MEKDIIGSVLTKIMDRIHESASSRSSSFCSSTRNLRAVLSLPGLSPRTR